MARAKSAKARQARKKARERAQRPAPAEERPTASQQPASASEQRASASGQRAPAPGQPAAEQQTPAAPTPAMLRGRTDPARDVTAVDYTLTAAQKNAVRRRIGEAHAAAGKSAREQDPSDHLPPPPRTGSVPHPSSPSHAAPPPSAPPPALPPPAPRPSPRPRTIEPERPLPPPPPGAVHSLNPDDARPFTRPLTIDEGLIRNVGVPDVTAEQIIRAVADPEDSWSADAGASDHFQRGPLTVQVRRADNAVIGAFTTAYALSVRPERYERSLDAAIEAAGPSARGGRGTRHPTTRRELMQRMREAGFVIEHGSTHGRVSHPSHPGLFVPLASTPSDVRYTRHAVAQVRRVFGIDLRR